MTPQCSQNMTAETLSAWYDTMLPAAEVHRIGEHIPTCALCQSRVQQFRDIHAILLRQPQLTPGTRIQDALRSRILQRNMPKWTQARYLSSGITVSVLLLLAAAFFFVFVNHQPGIAPPLATATIGHPVASSTPAIPATVTPTATASPTATALPTIPALVTPTLTGIAGTWASQQSGGTCYLLTITPTTATAVSARLSITQPTCASAIVSGFPMSGTFDGTTLTLSEVSGSAELLHVTRLAQSQPASPRANCGDTSIYAFFNASAQSLTGDLTVCAVATPMTFTRVG